MATSLQLGERKIASSASATLKSHRPLDWLASTIRKIKRALVASDPHWHLCLQHSKHSKLTIDSLNGREINPTPQRKPSPKTIFDECLPLTGPGLGENLRSKSSERHNLRTTFCIAHFDTLHFQSRLSGLKFKRTCCSIFLIFGVDRSNWNFYEIPLWYYHITEFNWNVF